MYVHGDIHVCSDGSGHAAWIFPDCSASVAGHLSNVRSDVRSGCSRRFLPLWISLDDHGITHERAHAVLPPVAELRALCACTDMSSMYVQRSVGSDGRSEDE